jgi:hypothetical protein
VKTVDPVSVRDPFETTPLSRREKQLLDLYATDATLHPLEVFCSDCPDRTTARNRARCCRRPEPPRTLFARLKARFT